MTAIMRPLARLVRASSTNGRITRLRSSSSGCQSTPSAKRLSGSSIASDLAVVGVRR